MAGEVAAALTQRLRTLQATLPARVVSDLQVAAPKKTRQLERSIRGRGRLIGPVITVTVETPVVQAATTNTGARPHRIVPRRAKALRFQVGGRTVFARSVNHPGNKPTFWWTRTVSAWPQIVASEMRRLR